MKECPPRTSRISANRFVIFTAKEEIGFDNNWEIELNRWLYAVEALYCMAATSSRYYRANTPKVLFEAFEDETVLINLDSGNYYSFSGSGALIWNCLARGDSVNSVVDDLQQSFGNKDGIAPAVEDFVRELVEEN